MNLSFIVQLKNSSCTVFFFMLDSTNTFANIIEDFHFGHTGDVQPEWVKFFPNQR